jgi:hypothetical protein
MGNKKGEGEGILLKWQTFISFAIILTFLLHFQNEANTKI